MFRDGAFVLFCFGFFWLFVLFCFLFLRERETILSLPLVILVCLSPVFISFHFSCNLPGFLSHTMFYKGDQNSNVLKVSLLEGIGQETNSNPHTVLMLRRRVIW